MGRLPQRRSAHYVPFWTRFCDLFVRAREVLDSGVLGEIRGVYRWHNPRPMDMPLTCATTIHPPPPAASRTSARTPTTPCAELGREAVKVQAHADTMNTRPRPTSA